MMRACELLSRARLLTAVLICLGMLAAAAALVLTAIPAPPPASAHRLASHHRLQSLPSGLAAAASASIGASQHAFWPVRHGSSLLAQGGGIQGSFSASGASLRVAKGTLDLSLAAVGHGQHLQPVAAAAPSPADSQVLYRQGLIGAFYRSGAYGLEQGFTVQRRPQGNSGSLVLSLGIGGSLIGAQTSSEIMFRTQAGAKALQYGQLSAVDATGRRLPAVMQLRNRTLELRIDDRNARYPLRIDPFIQQGAKLTGSDEGSEGEFGYSVALSADGNTALIGGRPTTTASRGGVGVHALGLDLDPAGPKLTATGESGKGEFGSSVALSADGNTALIGGPTATTDDVGAAWVFTRSGSTWTQQGAKLTGTGESGKGELRPKRGAVRRRQHRADRRARTTTAASGRRGCSRARARPGPSRAQSSPAAARPASAPSATAWRCPPTATPR